MAKIWTKKDIACRIDHTNLKAIATPEQIVELCQEAIRNGFATVCVNSCNVGIAARELDGQKVGVCAVVGFPLGASATEIKADEARLAVKEGASEIDMVINLGALKGGDARFVEEDIRAVVKASAPAIVKVIIECCYLSDAEKVLACKLSEKAGASFVKTSTGFGPSGATVVDVKLMRETVGNRLRVKAAGGIRSYRDAIEMVEAGADRIGASSSVSILAELPEGPAGD